MNKFLDILWLNKGICHTPKFVILLSIFHLVHGLGFYLHTHKHWGRSFTISFFKWHHLIQRSLFKEQCIWIMVCKLGSWCFTLAFCFGHHKTLVDPSLGSIFYGTLIFGLWSFELHHGIRYGGYLLLILGFVLLVHGMVLHSSDQEIQTQDSSTRSFNFNFNFWREFISL